MFTRKFQTLGLALIATAGLSALSVSSHAAIIYDNFESGAGNWTTSNASYLTTYDFGSGDVGVVALDTEKDGTPLTLTTPLLLDTWNATTINIKFTGEWGDTGSTTRFFNLERSSNNGSTWTSMVQLNSNQTPAVGGYTYSTAAGLTDEFLFRFRPKNDGTNVNDWVFYLNDVTITHDGVIPEPGTLALLGLGALMMLPRRRAAA